VYGKGDICQTIKPGDFEGNENLHYEVSPRNIEKKPLPNPFLANQHGKKRNLETEDDDEEFDADLTVIGGTSSEWIVNGIRIRERLTAFQSTILPRTKPEYYDILFFNSHIDGFLQTLDESIITQMLSDISDKETENVVESKIELSLDRLIDRDIKKTKEKLKQVKEKDTGSFESIFALSFVRHM